MKYYIVDAFTDKLFGGNQAGVCILEKALEDTLLQSIASENNLAETAFVLKREDKFLLRWFSPKTEIELCGHATLAAAYVLDKLSEDKTGTFEFETKSGILTVEKKGDFFEMDFPSFKHQKTEITPLMRNAFGAAITEAYASRDLILVFDAEKNIKEFEPDFEKIKLIKDYFAVIITAKGKEADFVSRFFAPNIGINEDWVTGSSHSALIPFWAERLNKKELIAKQLSERGGILFCMDDGERVKISGRAVLYMSGEINL